MFRVVFKVKVRVRFGVRVRFIIDLEVALCFRFNLN